MPEITLQAFCQALDEWMQVESYKDYGPNGLQVEGVSGIRKVATGVSASLATIEAAVEAGVQALVVHHGMFWKKDDYCITGSKAKKIELLIKNGISLFGYHLPLDAHREFGNNWRAAHDLGWDDLEPFGYFDGMEIGVTGTFSPMTVDAFRAQLESYYAHTAHCALGGKPEIRSAALVSGGAHWSIKDAVKAGVDCFITGSFDEPIWHIAQEEGIHFFALGHSATERVGPRALGEEIQHSLGIETVFLDQANPF